MSELCPRPNGKFKVSFRSRAAAEKVRHHSALTLFSYHCQHCRKWHLTHEPRRAKTENPPSIAKLKRKLQNAALLIAAQQRTLDLAQAKLAAAQAEHDEEIRCIAALYELQHRRVK